MGKRYISLMLVISLCITSLIGCGRESKKQEGVTPAPKTPTEIVSDPVTTEDISEQEPAQESAASSEDAESTGESVDEAFDKLNAIGDINVDKGIFDVEVTIPKDLVGETTQDELDKTADEKGYKSATLNSDGSVTYVMTKAQHKEMLEDVVDSINDYISEVVNSDDYPNIASIDANSDYTSYTINMKTETVSLMESFVVLGLYTMSGMYGIVSGEWPDNVHVDFVNASTGQVIESANSEDMGQ